MLGAGAESGEDNEILLSKTEVSDLSRSEICEKPSQYSIESKYVYNPCNIRSNLELAQFIVFTSGCENYKLVVFTIGCVHDSTNYGTAHLRKL